jgi:deazaflavin-dependent oxidoreductase (nitroreductase family)
MIMPLAGDYEPGPTDWVAEQVKQYETTNGVEGGTFKDKPVVIITSLGAKSGKIRKHPVMRTEFEGQYAVIASNAGAEKHPTWYYNLVAHPVVELQDGANKADYTVRELDGDEKDLWWDRAMLGYNEFDSYQEAVERQIPLLLLTPVAKS